MYAIYYPQITSLFSENYIKQMASVYINACCKRVWKLPYTRLRRSSSIAAASSTIACLSSWIVMIRLQNTRSFRNPLRKKSGQVACSVARPYCTRLFPVGVPVRPCGPVAYHDYSRTQTRHCWRSCSYWWGPTEARVRQLPDALATMHSCK